MGIIRDLWIIQDGVVIFKVVNKEIVNSQLFGAYMSAVHQFSSELTQHGMQEFELKSLRFLIKRNNKLLFVCNAPKKIRKKKMEKEINQIMAKFLDSYPPEFLNAWDGDVSVFDDFRKVVDNSLMKAISNFQDSIW